jgi:high affinity choline transporter 7
MINIGGIVAIVVFYLLILFVGIWAAKKKGNGGESEEEVMLAGRNIGLFVGIFTMTGIKFLGFCPSSESVTKK